MIDSKGILMATGFLFGIPSGIALSVAMWFLIGWWALVFSFITPIAFAALGAAIERMIDL